MKMSHIGLIMAFIGSILTALGVYIFQVESSKSRKIDSKEIKEKQDTILTKVDKYHEENTKNAFQSTDTILSSLKKISSLKSKSNESYDVKSYNQQGGITAGKVEITINKEKEPILSDEDKSIIGKELDKNKELEIEIESIENDNFSYKLSEQVNSFIISKNRKVLYRSATKFSRPQDESIIEFLGNKIRFTCGSKYTFSSRRNIN